MSLEHGAIWTEQLEVSKNFYVKFFDGVPKEKYTNEKKQFQSYFLSFQSGARLELMQMVGVPANTNDRVVAQHQGIIHLAFGVDTMDQVDEKAKQLANAGFLILSGPRKTGDGYYEFETLDPDNNRLGVTTFFKES